MKKFNIGDLVRVRSKFKYNKIGIVLEVLEDFCLIYLGNEEWSYETWELVLLKGVRK